MTGGQLVTDVADGVFAVVNGDGTLGLANSCVLLDGRTATVVDTMLTPSMAQGVRDAVGARNAVAAQVVNTHNHMDHVGGNVVFPEASVVAHPTTARIIGLMARQHDWLPGLFPRHADELARLEFRTPTAALDDLVLPSGARLLVHEQAHSPVDLAVWMPEQEVLVTGDLCSNGIVPLARHGRLAVWIDALDALLALGPRAVVPGHGPVGGPDALRAVRGYLALVRETGVRLVAAGAGAEAIDDALAGLDLGAVGDWLEQGRHRVNLEVALAEASGTPLPVGPPR